MYLSTGSINDLQKEDSCEGWAGLPVANRTELEQECDLQQPSVKSPKRSTEITLTSESDELKLS